MTRLLVSVRDMQEARIAFNCGAELIDLKEPQRGSLGASDTTTISEVIAHFGEHVPISVALGELLEEGMGGRLPAVHRASFVKAGLAGCSSIADWEKLWHVLVEQLPLGVRSVGVVYADFERAASPAPDKIIRLARRFGCAAVLVDTFDKSSGPLTQIWDREQIGSFILEVQQRKMLAVLAGSLGESDIANLLPLRPDIFAVRGAVCRGSRTSSIDGDKVTRLKSLLAEWKEPELRMGELRQLA